MQVQTVLMRLRSGRGISNALYRGDLIFLNGDPELVVKWSGQRGSSNPETKIRLVRAKLVLAPPGRGYDYLYAGCSDELNLQAKEIASSRPVAANQNKNPIGLTLLSQAGLILHPPITIKLKLVREENPSSAISKTDLAIVEEVMADAVERRSRQIIGE